MNPEENNPLASSTGMSGMGGMNNTSSMPGVGGLSMADSLASAQDNLTSAGLAAPSGQGVMGLDQLGASNPEAIMAPPMEDPLVPAAPVPGSIGSVTSMPANSGAVNPFAPAEQPAAMPLQGGQVPVPEVAPQAPFNPFAPAEPAAQNPAAPAVGTPISPAQPAGNSNMAAQPSTTNQPKPNGLNPAFQPAAPASASKSKNGKKTPTNIPLILLAGLSAILAVALIIFIVLFIDAKNNPKIVYVPTTSNEDSGSALEILTCSKETDFSFLVGAEYPINGSETFSASYSKGNIQALNLEYDIIFGEGYDLNVARDNLAAGHAELIAAVGSEFTADYIVEEDELIGNIKSRDGALTEDGINAFLHPDGTNLGKNSIDDLRSTYEAAGYSCTVNQ